MRSLLVHCNVCQVHIGFGKVVFFFLHARMAVWIDLGETAPPANVCPDLATEPLFDACLFQLLILYH